MRATTALVALTLPLALACDGNSPTSTSGTLTIVPAGATLSEGESLNLQVVPADGAAGAAVSWSSTRPLVAAVDAAGRVTTRNELGTAQIVATVDGATAVAEVSVEARCGDPAPLTGNPAVSAQARPMAVTLADGLNVDSTAQALARELGFTITEILPDGFRAALSVPTVAELRCRSEVVAIAYPT
ncbi:MAG: hypothetical protein R2991_02365 [Thermoanaerobaculia bacterium]